LSLFVTTFILNIDVYTQKLISQIFKKPPLNLLLEKRRRHVMCEINFLPFRFNFLPIQSISGQDTQCPISNGRQLKTAFRQFPDHIEQFAWNWLDNDLYFGAFKTATDRI